MIYPNLFFCFLWILSPVAAFNAITTIAGNGVAANTDGVGTAAELASPRAISPYGSGYLFTTEHMVRFLDDSTAGVTTLAGQSAYGSADGDGTDASFRMPYGVAAHPTDGYALIADHRNYLLRKMTLTAPYTVTTVAGNKDIYNNADGSGTNASFMHPMDVAISPDGTLAVVLERYSPRVRKVDITANPYVVTLLAGSNQGTLDGTGSNANFWNPNFLAFNHDGSALFVSESQTRRIRHVTVPGGVVTVFCGNLQPTLVDGDCTSVARFVDPQGLAVSNDGSTLYVSDLGRLRAIDINARIVTTVVDSALQVSIGMGLAFSPDESRAFIPAATSHVIRALFTQISPPPTGVPTSQPTEGVAEHIYVHAIDLHGDGWGTNMYLAVKHDDESEPSAYYSLNCGCKVIRLFSLSGDMTISIHRNSSLPGPRGEHVPFEWEALFTLGYSDGVTATPFDVYGDVDTEVIIDDWSVMSSARALDTAVESPKNKCSPPPPPKRVPSIDTTSNDTNSTDSTEGDDESGPPPLVNVRLTLRESDGSAWCDDSGSSHVLACSKEHHLSINADLPNILTYPRYYISDKEGRNLMQHGTMRVDTTQDVRELKLPREGSFVFSVSGHYLSESGTLSWDFCGEQGDINERLYFNMVHGVCKPHYIASLSDDISCEGEWTTGSHLLSHPIEQVHASSELSRFRFGLQVETLVAAALGLVALIMLVTIKLYRRSTKKIQFAQLDSTEHVL